ncbi:prolactin-releasing peptide [Saccopteryx bilineata]|uniref:prolactin-releasing peptide n=1 Tax=Saccopteryx bilineata TaxID=59482 RepID=UPI0033905A70
MTVWRASLLCLLLLGLVLQGTASRAHPHTVEIHTPDVDPAWYASRRIRPVGRFGRRRVALRDFQRPLLWHQRAASPWKEAGDSPALEE